MSLLRKLPAWQALQAHADTIRGRHLREFFAEDAERASRLAAEAEGLYFDFSKHRITAETLDLLVQLAEQSHLRDRIAAMFSGEKINITENRAVLHLSLIHI